MFHTNITSDGLYNFTTVHNQNRDFVSLIEHHYKDPYLVDAYDKFSTKFIPKNAYCLISFVGAEFTKHNKGLMRVLIEVVLDDLRAKWHYNQLRVHWYIPWLKTLLVNVLLLHKRHATWYARIRVMPELLYSLQSIDLWANRYQGVGNDTNMGSNDA